MTKDELIELINHTVYENEDGDITGEVMNLVLNAIVATIGVEANPEDEATGTLNKIKIGEEVFDVEGGGGTVDPYPTEGSTNPVQSGGVFTALNNLITNGCLFGGEVSPQEQIPHGNDHGYFYLAIKDGIYTNFSSSIELTNCIAIIFWDTNTQNWGFLDINYNVDYVDNRLNGKQDTISDLADIRSGASAGATAYQKPSGGIPKTDLASGVQTSLGKADTAFQKPSDGIPASDLASGVIPNSVVNATSQQDGTLVLTMVNGDTITIDLNHQHPNYYSKVTETTQPSGGMLPDVTYKLGTLTGATTFSFAAAVSGNVNHYYFTFTSGTTAVVPTWPASITSWDGNCVDSTTGLPVIAASKTYEVSVLDGNAIIKEW